MYTFDVNIVLRRVLRIQNIKLDCGGHNCIRKCHVEWDRISKEEYEREWGRVEPDDEGEVS